MEHIFLAIGILANTFSCIIAALSLNGFNKRLSKVEDDNESQDSLLSLFLLNLYGLNKNEKQNEKRN